MCFFLLLILTLPLSAQLISEVRYKISAGDLASADAITDEFCRTKGPTSECADATAWLARGAVLMGDHKQAHLYIEQAKQMNAELLKKLTPDDDPYLAASVGAVIESEAKLLAAQGETPKAIAMLHSELTHWNSYALQARIQKNLNLLTLEGKQAPLPPPGTAGKPVLLFLWGHWCSDCTAQAPIIARIRQQYQSKGLVIVAPTRRRGTIDGDHTSGPGDENTEIERVWKESYAGLKGIAHPVDQATMLAYGVSSTPTLVLIDRKGIVRLYCPYRLSESALAKKIDPLL